jgi:DNA-binding MarR family transcriptional regulator
MPQSNREDFIRDLGELALGSRMKRLLERLNGDISRFYGLLGIDFKASWFSVLYLLGTQSPMSITGIAGRIGFTHPAVNKIVAQMSKAGLVVSSRYDMDKRKRLVDLTSKGKDIYRQLTPVWNIARGAVADLLSESGGGLLESIDKVEQSLDQRSLYRRMKEQSKPRLLEEIEIVEYAPSLKKHFKELTYEWLREYHKVEKHDEATLSDPDGTIIKPGGRVLFARLKGKIVGTCALIRHDDGIHEIAKLAVTKAARGRFVATKLMTSIIDKARESGVEELYAETDPEHSQVDRLTETLGFEKIRENPIPRRYERPCEAMVLRLNKEV